MQKEKEKKEKKKPYTQMHPNITCNVRGCSHPIKQNVVDRTPERRFTCYFHGMQEKGKTHLGGIPIKDLIHDRDRKAAV